MTQIQDLTERDARMVAQEIVRGYGNGELYDVKTFTNLCDRVGGLFPSLLKERERFYGLVRGVLRTERRRRATCN